MGSAAAPLVAVDGRGARVSQSHDRVDDLLFVKKRRVLLWQELVGKHTVHELPPGIALDQLCGECAVLGE
jgi:hypothetical protein